MTDRITLLDLPGLAVAPSTAYVEALGLGRIDHVVTGADSWDWLGRLIHGAGVTVYTGPLGVPFWQLVSPEVAIKVVPDDYIAKDRLDEFAWSLSLEGCTPAEVSTLRRSYLDKGKSPTSRHQLHRRWAEAALHRRHLHRVREVSAPLVKDLTGGVTILGPDVASTFLRGITERFAADWEWDEGDRSPVGLSIAFGHPARTYYIPVRAQGADVGAADYGVLVQRALADALRRDGVSCVFHNGRSDIGTQHDGDPLDLVGQHIDDTIVMAWLADPDAQSLGLKPLTRSKLGREPVEYPGDIASLPLEVAARYAGADARNTYDLYEVLLKELMEAGQYDVYKRLERPLIPVVASMERGGTPVDTGELARLYREHVDLEARVRRAVMAGYGVDLASDDATRAWLASVIGYDPGDLDQRNISRYPAGEVDVVLLYRQTRTRRRSFLKPALVGWARAGRPTDYRLYPNFNQAGRSHGDGDITRAPGTGRFSSSNPNLQNQPVALRSMFVGPPGCLFWTFDYSQLELRIAAAQSADQQMLSGLASGDPHGDFQRYIFETTGRTISRAPTAKSANFEKLYLGGDEQLVNILQKNRVFIEYETAVAIGEAHRARHPQYYRHVDSVLADARANGYSETMFHRRRYLPDLFSDDPTARGHAERAAFNHTVQGTAADIVKLAMMAVLPVLAHYGGHLAGQVHDELYGWVDADVDKEAFECDMSRVMSDVVALTGVELEVSGKVARTWAEAH